MDSLESRAHSFIIRIWLEETAAESGVAKWRGYIIDAISGKRHYLQNLDEIPAFIAPYLKEMGIKSGIRGKLMRWLKW